MGALIGFGLLAGTAIWAAWWVADRAQRTRARAHVRIVAPVRRAQHTASSRCRCGKEKSRGAQRCQACYRRSVRASTTRARRKRGW